MDNRPIGVFDSGVGGLTAVKELIKLMPNEDIIYFGDTGRVPYGTKSTEILIKYVRQDMNFLKSKDVKAVIAACGTASSVAIEPLREEFDIPIIGVLNPVCKKSVEITKNNRIGILGTPATINSGSYRKGIRNLCRDIAVFEKACPLFVPLVENGYINHEVTYIIAREYIEPLIEDEIDTLILGCTHYPLLTDVIRDVTKNKINIINAGEEAAIYARDILSMLNMQKDKNGNRTGKCEYYVSDDVEKFSYLGGLFLERALSSGVTKIDIEKYWEGGLF